MWGTLRFYSRVLNTTSVIVIITHNCCKCPRTDCPPTPPPVFDPAFYIYIIVFLIERDNIYICIRVKRLDGEKIFPALFSKSLIFLVNRCHRGVLEGQQSGTVVCQVSAYYLRIYIYIYYVFYGQFAFAIRFVCVSPFVNVSVRNARLRHDRFSSFRSP